MKISVEKALQVCGNNNRYQKLFYIAVALTWFSVDFVAICFPLLELLPGDFKCKDEKGNWNDLLAGHTTWTEYYELLRSYKQ